MFRLMLWLKASRVWTTAGVAGSIFGATMRCSKGLAVGTKRAGAACEAQAAAPTQRHTAAVMCERPPMREVSHAHRLEPDTGDNRSPSGANRRGHRGTGLASRTRAPEAHPAPDRPCGRPPSVPIQAARANCTRRSGWTGCSFGDPGRSRSLAADSPPRRTRSG